MPRASDRRGTSRSALYDFITRPRPNVLSRKVVMGLESDGPRDGKEKEKGRCVV